MVLQNALVQGSVRKPDTTLRISTGANGTGNWLLNLGKAKGVTRSVWLLAARQHFHPTGRSERKNTLQSRSPRSLLWNLLDNLRPAVGPWPLTLLCKTRQVNSFSGCCFQKSCQKPKKKGEKKGKKEKRKANVLSLIPTFQSPARRTEGSRLVGESVK